MPLSILPTASNPHFSGLDLSVTDMNLLADLCAQVMVGRAYHAISILNGSRSPSTPLIIRDELKERLRASLHPSSEATKYHRDGLLFEIICWVAAHITATSNEVISYPHLSATTQGLDCIKITFDPVKRELIETTVYEYKCSTKWRAKFLEEVIPAFRQYLSGQRDDHLSQATISMLSQFNLKPDERDRVYNDLVRSRPLAFQASMTVQPGNFSETERTALFKGYDGIGGSNTNRGANTMSLDDVRDWFTSFAALVWTKIDSLHV